MYSQCSFCQMLIYPDWIFCENCGTQLRENIVENLGVRNREVMKRVNASVKQKKKYPPKQAPVEKPAPVPTLGLHLEHAQRMVEFLESHNKTVADSVLRRAVPTKRRNIMKNSSRSPGWLVADPILKHSSSIYLEECPSIIEYVKGDLAFDRTCDTVPGTAGSVDPGDSEGIESGAMFWGSVKIQPSADDLQESLRKMGLFRGSFWGSQREDEQEGSGEVGCGDGEGELQAESASATGGMSTGCVGPAGAKLPPLEEEDLPAAGSNDEESVGVKDDDSDWTFDSRLSAHVRRKSVPGAVIPKGEAVCSADGPLGQGLSGDENVLSSRMSDVTDCDMACEGAPDGDDAGGMEGDVTAVLSSGDSLRRNICKEYQGAIKTMRRTLVAARIEMNTDPLEQSLPVRIYSNLMLRLLKVITDAEDSFDVITVLQEHLELSAQKRRQAAANDLAQAHLDAIAVRDQFDRDYADVTRGLPPPDAHHHHHKDVHLTHDPYLIKVNQQTVRDHANMELERHRVRINELVARESELILQLKSEHHVLKTSFDIYHPQYKKYLNETCILRDRTRSMLLYVAARVIQKAVRFRMLQKAEET